MKLYEVYAQKAIELVKSFNKENTFGILDIFADITDTEHIKISTCFLCKKESYGYSLSVLNHGHGSGEEVYPHKLRAEKFSEYEYKFEFDHKGTLLQFMNKKDDNTWNIEIEDINSMYSRLWELDVCNK